MWCSPIISLSLTNLIGYISSHIVYPHLSFLDLFYRSSLRNYVDSTSSFVFDLRYLKSFLKHK